MFIGRHPNMEQAVMRYGSLTHTHRALRAVLALAGGLAAAGASHAQSPSGTLDQRYWLQVGAFRPSIDSEVRYDRTDGGLGTIVDFERELGLADSKTVPNVLFGVRLNERWRPASDRPGRPRFSSRPAATTSAWATAWSSR
jgi:hypothetical protein